MGKPVSNAERKRKNRESLTDEKKQEIRNADKERKRNKQAAEQLTMDQLAEKRRKDQERQMRSRMKSKISQPVKISIPFKTKQAKGKTVNRVHKTLPSTLRKIAEVIKEPFLALTPSSQSRIKNPKNNLCSNVLPEETVELVTSFYENDSILRV